MYPHAWWCRAEVWRVQINVSIHTLLLGHTTSPPCETAAPFILNQGCEGEREQVTLLSFLAVAQTGLSYHFKGGTGNISPLHASQLWGWWPPAGDREHESVKDDEDMRERKRIVWVVFKKLHSWHSSGSGCERASRLILVSSANLESMNAERREDFRQVCKRSAPHLIRGVLAHLFLCLSGRHLAFWTAAGGL